MSILSFQFEDSFSISHEVGLVVMNFIKFALSRTVFNFSVISERQLFWKEYSWLAVFLS